MRKVEFFLVVELEEGKTERRPYPDQGHSIKFEKHVPEEVDTLRGQAVLMLGSGDPKDGAPVLAVIETHNGSDETAYVGVQPKKLPTALRKLMEDTP